MNLVAIEVLKRELGNVEDNLYRAHLQQRNDASWVSANGESVGHVIMSYQNRAATLRESLRQLQEGR